MTIFIGNTGSSTAIYGNITVNIIKPPDFGGAYSWDNARWLDTQILRSGRPPEKTFDNSKCLLMSPKLGVGQACASLAPETPALVMPKMLN